jgi:hypothetical protein
LTFEFVHHNEIDRGVINLHSFQSMLYSWRMTDVIVPLPGSLRALPGRNSSLIQCRYAPQDRLPVGRLEFRSMTVSLNLPH